MIWIQKKRKRRNEIWTLILILILSSTIVKKTVYEGDFKRKYLYSQIRR